MRRGIFGLAFLAVCAWLAGATLGGTVGGGGGGGANGQTTITFGASPNLIAPSGNLTLTAADGGVVLDTNRLQLGSGNSILWPSGNGSILAPDGGITIGPNKTTFQSGIKDETERCLFSFSVPGTVSGSAFTGVSLGTAKLIVTRMKFAGPVTATALAGMANGGSGTGTAAFRVTGPSGTCECTHDCTVNSFRDTCVNGLGNGCVFGAADALQLEWSTDQDGGTNNCATNSINLVSMCVLGKHQ